VSGWFYQSDVCALERAGAGCLVPFGAGMLLRVLLLEWCRRFGAAAAGVCEMCERCRVPLQWCARFGAAC